MKHLGPKTLLSAVLAVAAALLLSVPTTVSAQETIPMGVIYDLSGPLAGGGSEASYHGAMIAIEMVNEKGGVLGKHKIEPVTADAQSKPDVAINEAERLLNSVGVDIIDGIYSSAQAVPLAQKMDQQHKILWITTAISSAVFKDRHLKYVFRGQAHSDQAGETSVKFLSEMAQPKMSMNPQDLRVAIIHEDGPYGSGVASGNEAAAEAAGMNVVLTEGYSLSTPDLSSLVIKLKRARPDVILHTGYNPDITLFMRQSKELGLRWKALIGHGAGHGQIDKLYDTFGADVDYLFNVDPVAAQLLDPKTLASGVGELTQEMVKRYKAKTGASEVPPHVSMGFNQTWVLLNDVLPRAKQKYGSFEPDAVRKAALETDIPEGGTIQGYGVKFAPPDHKMAGQNLRSTPVVMQYVGGKTYVSYPTSIQTREPVLPLPDSSPYAAR